MSQTQTRRSSQVDLLHGPILKSLLLFALPIMASRVFQQIYNTMDTLIVGYTLGDSSIAAMGACSSIYEMMTGFTFGVGNGLAVFYGPETLDIHLYAVVKQVVFTALDGRRRTG